MTPFQRARSTGSRMTPAEKQRLADKAGVTLAEVEAQIAEVAQDVIWLNDRYQVHVRDAGDFIHLSIKRIDKAPIHDWRDLQAIKNELVGPENEGLELYPAESRLVDTANQYHLWVLKDPDARLPVGWTQRLVMDHDPDSTATRQRPLATGGAT